MMRAASVKLNVTAKQASRLVALRAAYADVCNRLFPLVGQHSAKNLQGWRQLYSFVKYKAKAVGIAVEHVSPADTSQHARAVQGWGSRGTACRAPTWIGGMAVPPRGG